MSSSRGASYLGGVGGLGVVLQRSRQPEVGHLADQVTVHQDVSGRQVAVDVAHVGQVPAGTRTGAGQRTLALSSGHPSDPPHSGRDAAQHSHQLDDRELTIVLLPEDQKGENGRVLSITDRKAGAIRQQLAAVSCG